MDIRMILKRRSSQKKLYPIRSAKDLLDLAERVNYQGEGFDGWLVQLECTIDLGNIEWKPIGHTIEKPFCGEFDGKGHTIKGLRMEAPDGHAGLFGVLKGFGATGIAEVRNLCLTDCEITATGHCCWAGALAGYASEGVVVENCQAQGTIRSRSFAGGILGGADGSVSIRNCHTEGSVQSQGEDGKNMAGAIVGKLTTNSILRDCQNNVLDASGEPLQRQIGKFDDPSRAVLCGRRSDR